MVVQGQWEKDSPLLQLPHITPQTAAAAAAKDIGTVFDLIEMDEEERRELLQVGRWFPVRAYDALVAALFEGLLYVLYTNLGFSADTLTAALVSA